MRTILGIIIVIVILVSLFGYSKNRDMHSELVKQLSTSEDILAVTGKFVSYEYLHSGSDCKYGGSCDQSLWEFKVTGEKECIKVDVILHESFPTYYVVSVKPAVYWETRYINDALTNSNKRIQGCT